jgi:hypothetical protein
LAKSLGFLIARSLSKTIDPRLTGIAAWYGGNSWVDATGDVSAAARADRRGLLVLTVAYFAALALLLVLTLT